MVQADADWLVTGPLAVPPSLPIRWRQFTASFAPIVALQSAKEPVGDDACSCTTTFYFGQGMKEGDTVGDSTK